MLSQFRLGLRKLFQIKANFGFTSGLVGMLMQSQPESGEIDSLPVIRILPPLPKEWPEGKVTGLLARGGFEIDIEWKGGKLITCRITSLNGNPCTVRYGNQTKELKMKKGESRMVFGN